MPEDQLPVHLATFLDAIQEDPALSEGAKCAVGDLTGHEAARVAAEYYRSHGYSITAGELLALETSRKSASVHESDDDGFQLDEQLDAVSGGSDPRAEIVPTLTWRAPFWRDTPGLF